MNRNSNRAVIVASAFILFAALTLAGCSSNPGTSAEQNVSVDPPVAIPYEEVMPELTHTGPAAPPAEFTAATVSPPQPPTAEEVKRAWLEGVSLYDERDYEGAAERLGIAASGRPDHTYTQYLHGLALWKSGELEGAEQSLHRATELDPSFLRAWLNLGRVRMERNDPEGCLTASAAALEIDGENADGLHLRGRALEAQGLADEALKALEQAHEADPENGYIANTLGLALINRERFDEAAIFLEMARERIPQVAYVRNNLGVAYERTGRLELAAEEYRAAVEAGDSGGKAAISLARIEPRLETEIVQREDSDPDTTTTPTTVETETVARHSPDLDGSSDSTDQ
jgi:Flp pilus assembly protein TadD